ncbi:diguanylate cyclase (GGDEF) domain-containing protein [Methylobacterium phyllostachyos]|uniref:Diguanylate cyclase (GGDEF) domain-containing protein n=1 Tax=Methylobacterium phyllostachyos TaxID=582672 RepID=A0A1H0CKK2_9HYPH|nr:EAL domain-containing protein [Methylobacterium phyllostachyos]SDN58321.1 diguanylate cyclase (GGDEF) domain-containing protein [Methylobacterium phyllostachyos]
MRDLRSVFKIASIRLRGTPIMGCGILATVIAFAAAVMVVDLQRQATRDITRGLTSLSTVLADQADRALQAMELAQEAVIHEFHDAHVTDAAGYAALATRHDLYEELRTRIASLPQVNAITVLDHTGKLLNFSRYWPIPDVDLSDRDYFQALVSDPALQRFISRPVRNRGNAVWTIYVARKVTAPDGTFLGLVLGAVELSYFEDLYRRIIPADDYVVGVFRRDGMLMVRYPHRDDATGNAYPSSAATLFAAKGIASGEARIVSPIDGQDRFVSVQSLDNYPLMLIVSRTAKAALAPFRQQAGAIIVSATLLTACLVGLGFSIARRLRDRENQGRAEERLRGEHDLRVQHTAFGVALDNMAQGLCLFDGQCNLVIMNARFAALYAIPDGLRCKGVPAEAIRGHICSRLVAEQDRNYLLAEPPGETRIWDVIELNDGRAIDVARAPVPGGGWVCTHEDITERRRAEERMRFLAGHDALTALPNRRLFQETVERELAACAAAGTEAALLCVDLDGFKQINDIFGHPAGDALLIEVAGRLRDVFGAGSMAARLGGDEFAVLATDLGSARTPGDAARAIIGALTPSFRLDDARVEVGCSVGVAVFPRDGAAYDRLLGAADMALYRAKCEDKGTFSLFEPAMDIEARERHRLASDLRSAIGTGQFDLHYQPQVEVATGRVTGFEALLRWHHPIRGPISPAQFIPIAEETGLILPLGEWVLQTACREAAGWAKPLGIAVNLSIAQFRQSGLPDYVHAVLSETGLDPRRLELEITESLFLEDTTRARRVLRQLKAHGVRIAIDDFGTGYSSLLTLQSFPFDRLKIDRTFVSQIGVTQKGMAIVRAVIVLGENLGMPVIAEGIETEAQCAFLREHHCAEMQGYLYGRPRPIADYQDLLIADLEPACRLSA